MLTPCEGAALVPVWKSIHMSMSFHPFVMEADRGPWGKKDLHSEGVSGHVCFLTASQGGLGMHTSC